MNLLRKIVFFIKNVNRHLSLATTMLLFSKLD